MFTKYLFESNTDFTNLSTGYYVINFARGTVKVLIF